MVMECCICYEKNKKGKMIVIKTPCNHEICYDCIASLINKKESEISIVRNLCHGIHDFDKLGYQNKRGMKKLLMNQITRVYENKKLTCPYCRQDIKDIKFFKKVFSKYFEDALKYYEKEYNFEIGNVYRFKNKFFIIVGHGEDEVLLKELNIYRKKIENDKNKDYYACVVDIKAPNSGESDEIPKVVLRKIFTLINKNEFVENRLFSYYEFEGNIFTDESELMFV